MKRYNVTITETKERKFVVEAESETHAEVMVAQMWSENEKVRGIEERETVDFCVSEIASGGNTV